MAISTYAELQTAVTDWMARSDLSGNAVDFITLAEARLNRKLPLRELWENEALTGTTSSRTLTLPTDYIEAGWLRLTTHAGENPKLAQKTTDAIAYGSTNGTPTAWCIDAGTIRLDCPCDQAHTFLFRHRKKLDLATTSTNWLLTHHPDVYLAAVLVWGGAFIKDVEQASPWKGLLEEAIDELAWIEDKGEAGAALTVDPALVGRGAFNINVG